MLYLAADHGGWKMKEFLTHELAHRGIAFEDFGAFHEQPNDDYPGYAKQVAKAVIKSGGRGVLLCGSAQGVAITANRFKGIRAMVGWSTEVAVAAREDDDVNVLCLPARFISNETAWEILSTFLSTTFNHDDKYKRRINQIDEK